MQHSSRVRMFVTSKKNAGDRNKRIWTMTAVCLVAAALSASQADAALYGVLSGSTMTWDDGTTSDWATTSGGAASTAWASGSDAAFTSTGTITVAGSISSVNSLTFSAANTVLNGGTINLTNASGTSTITATSNTNIYTSLTGNVGVKFTGGAVNLLGTNTYTGATYDNGITLRLGYTGSAGTNSGTLGSGNVYLNGGILSLCRTDAFTLSNNINGSGALYMSSLGGGGTVTLAGVNTYSGDTHIQTGEIVVGVDSIGSTASITSGVLGKGTVYFEGGITGIASAGTTARTILNALSFASGTYTFGDATNTGNLTFLNKVMLNGNAIFNTPANTEFDGVISGNYSLAKGGTATLTLTGVNTYTGATSVNTGTLLATNSNSLGTSAGSVNVANGATLQLQGTALTFNNAITISGQGANNPNGALESLSGNNTWTGTINVAANQTRLTCDTGTFTVAGNIVLDAGGAANQLCLQATSTGALIITGNISGGNTNSNPTITKASYSNMGTGVVILAGNNTYLGTTLISLGTLQIGNGGTTGTLGAGNVTDNATLTFNRSNAYEFDYAISGYGAVTQIGTGTTTLAGNNTYTGATTISAGMLQIGNGGTTGSIASNVVNNSGLVFNRSDAYTFANVISGSGNVTQLGTGVLTLSVANTYTGATIVNAGTLKVTGSLVSNNLVLGGSSVASAIFDVSTKGGYSLATLYGVGTVQLASSSTNLTLTGAINHTGVDTLVVNGGLQLASGVTDAYEINLATDAYDSTSVAGVLNYNGSVLVINFSGSKSAGGVYTYDILNFGSYSGATSYSFTGLTAGESATYEASTGIVKLTVVPEPGTLALLLAVAMGLAACAWKRRK